MKIIQLPNPVEADNPTEVGDNLRQSLLDKERLKLVVWCLADIKSSTQIPFEPTHLVFAPYDTSALTKVPYLVRAEPV